MSRYSFGKIHTTNMDGIIVIDEKDRDCFRWLVLFGAFMGGVLSTGMILNAGTYVVEIQDGFGVGLGAVAGIATVLVCGNSGTAYFSGALCKRYGCRRVMAVGGLMTSLSTFLASFSSELWHLFACLTFAGIGSGLCFMPPVTVVKFYFQRRLGLANGVVFAGISAGILVMAPLIETLCSNYGLKGGMMIHSALLANLLVCAALFRPTRTELVLIRRSRASHRPGKEGSPHLREEHSLPWNSEIPVEQMNPEEASIHLNVLPEQDQRLLQGPGHEQQSHQHDDPTETQVTRFKQELPQLHSHGHQQYHGCSSRSTIFGRVVRRVNKVIRRVDAFFALSTLVRIRLYLVFTFANVLFVTGYISSLVSITPRLVNDLGVSKKTASIVMSVIGVSGGVARVVQGLILDFKLLGATDSYLIVTVLVSIVPLLTTVVKSLCGYFILAVVFGVGTSCAVSLVPAMCRQYVPVEVAPNAIGLTISCSSIGILIGTLLMGKLRDVTGSYSGPFLMTGCLMVTAAVIVGLVEKVSCWKRSKHEGGGGEGGRGGGE